MIIAAGVVVLTMMFIEGFDKKLFIQTLPPNYNKGGKMPVLLLKRLNLG